MSGLVRNFLTLIQAVCASGIFTGRSKIASYYWVTPFDSGLRLLKSDKYFQFAEAAQLDFLAKTKCLSQLLRSGVAFVNVSQLVKFQRPIYLFDRVRIESAIVFADERCAFFSHVLFVGDRQCAEVLVKMKFKKGAVTVKPFTFVGQLPDSKQPHIEQWEQALASMTGA